MLKTIQCDKFIERNRVRPPIIFKQGLNTLLGDEFAANSIGKSTFLMIIDFVFGGNDYVTKSINAQANIGSHTINFSFEFSDRLHYFSRSTTDPSQVNICDEHYQPLSVISKDDYTRFLSQKFNLDLPGLTLRNAISRFFRIYGRETLDPKLPLQNATKERQEAGIDGLLKLFDRYKFVAAQKKLTEQADLAEKSFKAAQKYNYLRAVTTKNDYKKSEKRIAELEREIQRLVRDSTEGFVSLEMIQAESSSELCQKLSVAKREYIKLTAELDSLESDPRSRNTFQKDCENLQQFFPGVNIRKLEDIEQFHDKLTNILKQQFKEKMLSLQSMIDLAAEQVAQLELKITEIGNSPHVSHAILNKHAEKLKELQLLQDSNANYDKKEQLKQETKDLKDKLNALVLDLLDQTETEINELMVELNKLIDGGKKIAPHLNIKDATRYSFITPNDHGTGSQYKGLILFDLAVLHLTNLPLLVHDSIFLKQIEDGVQEEILKLYADTRKQVFIALDKKGSFTEKAQKILQQTTILNLYPGGGELFGRAWNNIS